MTDTLISQFETALRSAGKSPHTVRAYTGDVTRFLDDVAKLPFDVGVDDIRRYLDQRIQKGLAKTSLNRQIVALKEFFALLVEQGLLATDPTGRIRKMKTPRALPKPLTQEQVAAVFAAIPASKPRDRALIGLAYHAGLRVSEIVALQPDQIDRVRRTLVVRSGKGDKDRLVLLNKSILRLLKAYEAEWPELPASCPYFPTASGRPLSVSRVQKLFKTYARKAGVNASIHAMRHSIATHLLEQGAPIQWIQGFLGHESVNTTIIYAKLTDRRRHDVFNQLEMAGAFDVRTGPNP